VPRASFVEPTNEEFAPPEKYHPPRLPHLQLRRVRVESLSQPPPRGSTLWPSAFTAKGTRVCTSTAIRPASHARMRLMRDELHPRVAGRNRRRNAPTPPPSLQRKIQRGRKPPVTLPAEPIAQLHPESHRGSHPMSRVLRCNRLHRVPSHARVLPVHATK
jgi:hypothetical protein